ncbi:hypothetical protein PPYR_13314 [Photinus pyralis]|uniref:DUF4371 domain-containing protein n=2 Tax=Photinus pyralis TaxID=7054 RepID=A0A5N4A8Q4_PHOPY|nr:hypothetical protein PPYR_13314 [Photinus pyralis]
MVTRKPKWSIFWLVSYAYSSYGTQSVKYSLILYRCKACKCDIKITHGKGDLVKHEYTSKHTKSCVSTVGQKTITSMFAEKTKEMTTEMRAKEAEIRIAGFVAEHNLPFKIMEHLPDLMRAVCSDSAIAKKIKCGPTKIKSIITNVTGETHRQNLIALMNSNKFSLIADESTDRSCTKNLCLVARINCNNNNVKDYFLALIPIHDATGAALFEHIIQFFNKYGIDFKQNCIGFASDGANNMMGGQNSVVSRIKELIPGIFVMKCICHSFHLCASYACEKLPEEVEKFARYVYNYFSNSPKRTEELKEFQQFANVSPVKMLHPSSTRWLSLESVVTRLLTQYGALTLYFTDKASSKKDQAAFSILHLLQQPETKLYLEFLAYALPFFNKLNTLMQSEQPQIHTIYKEVSNTIKTIMECFIKDSIMSKLNVYEIDFQNPRNFQNIEEMYFGAVINSSANSETLLQIKKQCLQFYIESLKQILSRFPLKDSIFSKLDFMDPETVVNRKVKSIADVVSHFSNLHSHSLQDIDSQWRMLRNINFDDFNLCIGDDIVSFWRKVSKIKLGTGEQKFGKLIAFVFNLLSLPHSSANVERCFSQINLNKTNMRNRLISSTLEGILLTKSLVSEGGQCDKFEINKEMCKKMNSTDLYKNKENEGSDLDSD